MIFAQSLKVALPTNVTNMDSILKTQADKLKRAYGEIIELKAEVAMLKRERGFVEPAPTIDIKPTYKITGVKHCVCLRNDKGYQLHPDGKYHCNQCEKALK